MSFAKGEINLATDPLSLVFMFCFLLGFGFFVMSALLGNHSHSGHAGHGHLPGAHHAPHVASRAHVTGQAQANPQQAAHQPAHTAQTLLAYLNPTSISLFLVGFGLFGYAFHNLANLAVSLSLLLAILSGLILSAVLLAILNRIFATIEGSTEQDVVDRTGMIGKVSITIPEKGLGEIIYTSPGGMRKSIPARGLQNQRLERDLEVVVVNYQNGVAEVDTWEHFMHEDTTKFDPDTFENVQYLQSLTQDTGSSKMEMFVQQEPQKE
jgi:hypothetical protein